jgi:DNA-binding transcriptional MerR regulator
VPAPEGTWTITELADEFGVTLRTIRHYEDVGLITPERRGTSRLFHTRDRIRLQLILRGKRLGFSLPEIRTIVNMYDEQPGEAGQLRYLIEQIDVRRAELEQMRRDIDETMTELDRVETRCREDLRRTGVVESPHEVRDDRRDRLRRGRSGTSAPRRRP